MKKALFWLLVGLMVFMPLLGMIGCNNTKPPVDPDQPSDPSTPSNPGASTTDPEQPDLSHLPSVPSDREVEIVTGSALHENTFGRIPQGLAEVVNKYMTSYEAMNLKGPLTTFQTSTYSEGQQLPTDAVMAYFSSKEGMASIVKQWDQVSDKYELHLMTIINRTNATHEYLSSDPSRMDQVMTLKNGTKMTHSGTTYYMMPNEEWTEYVWSMVEIALDTAELKTIVFEEPDLFKDSGYSKCFKREWQKYYGEPWQDQTSSPEAMYKSQKLKIHLLEKMMTTLIERIREKSPTTKVYIATHSTLSYNIVEFGGSVGTVSTVSYMLATGLLDGIIGQTWSDTAGAKLIQDGTTYQNRFFAGYLGYASYVDSVGDYDLFTLADPVGDGIGKNGRTEKDYYEPYFDTIVAQMLQPTINRYQVVVWPARSFEAASQDYRVVQLSVINAQTEAAGKAAIQSAGTPGISYVLSDSLSYQLNTNTTWAPSSHDSFMGLTLPLLSDGIPLTITAMENIKSVDDLKGINVLLLSFDGQKPVDDTPIEVIAEWIEQGGTCLYVGGHDAYDEMENVWWGSNSSPLQALLDMLNLDITVKDMELSADARMDWLGDGKQAALEALICPTSYNKFYSHFEGDVNAILDLEGYAVGIDETIGKGHLVALSLPTAILTKTVGGSEAVRKLAEYTCKYSEYKYDSTSLMWSKRGNVVSAYSIGQKNVLTGKYIDLFDAQLSLHTHYVLEADDSALLYDITDLKVTDTPVLAYTGGTVEVKENTKDKTHYIMECPLGATAATRFIVPDGLYPQSVTAQNYKGNIKVDAYCAWDSKTDSLLVRVQGVKRGTYVTIEWGTTPVEDYELQQPEGVDGFLAPLEQSDLDKLIASGKKAITGITTERGNSMDAEFIIRNTSKADAERYYCDAAREIVWKIDLDRYEEAYFAITVAQNYLLEVSTDGENWTVIQDFIKINGMRINAASNGATYGIDSKVYAKDANCMYVRLSNGDPTQGYGGSVSQYQIYYTSPVVPETDPADYAPLVGSLAQYDAAYASLHKYSVLTNELNKDKDADLLWIDRAQANQYCRYCDTNREVFYKIDLTKYEDAVVALQISQNYRVQVSADDRTYVTVQDWLLAGNEWTKGDNTAYLMLDSAVYAKDSDAMYIRIANADVTKGWGGRLESITVYYGGEVMLPNHPTEQPSEVPVLPEITVENYAPLAADLSAYDALYANRHKREVLSNQTGNDQEFIYANTAPVSANCRYCDRDRELTLKFDLTKYQDAVIALKISQNYRVLISFDGKEFVTVQDWILSGNEWGQITTANMTYAIIDTAAYAEGLSTFYVKIDNAGSDDQGWGGALHGFTIYYNGEEVKVEEPVISDEVANYLPVLTSDAEKRTELMAAYAKSETIIVNTSYPNSDAAFVAPGGDTDKINHLCKFCDANRSLTYVFDLSQYKDAVVMFRIANNYNVRVSSDRNSWTTVQDYVVTNGGVRIASAENMAWIVIDSAAFFDGQNQMYVCFSNPGGTEGWGAAIYEFTVFYNE